MEQYQAIQERDRFEVGGFVASFVVTPPPRSETLFIGLYQVLARGQCGAGGREPFTGLEYARTGHGGNVELKHRNEARYQVGLLQVMDTSLPDHRIEEIESWWKRKLMTREHGLNRN